MKNFKLIIAILIFSLSYQSCKEESRDATPPNIVWIMIEDWGYDLSCYGAKGVYTPNVDRLASDGIRFTNSFSTGPVCSPSRSAMMTGFHQNYIGANQHRTQGEGFVKKEPPNNIKPITELLREAGYYTCLMVSGKTDLNFTYEKPLFDGKDWSERSEGQPFFAQVTYAGTHRKWVRDPIRQINIDDVEIPPYYPDTPLTRRDWANGLESMQVVDRQIGELLKRLDDENLSDNTLVFLIGDNGRCMPRGKQFLYDGGIQVPIIARWPKKINKGQVNSSMVSTLDVTAAILEAAKIDPGYDLHGKDILSDEISDRLYIFAARDKMDDTFDAMRAIRSRRYKLIHNLMPERPYCQYNKYKEASYPVLALLNVLNLKGELTPEQSLFMAPGKPEFELFDLENDPFEVNNLYGSEEYSDVFDIMLNELEAWRISINDQGVSYKFKTGGWPATYPTRSYEEWEDILISWQPWVFREPGDTIQRPKISSLF